MPGDDVSLYFMHIPKCGGTSVRKRLRERFGEEFCPALVWDDFYRHPEWLEKRYKAYAGHFGSDLGSFLRLPLRTFTILRDPVPRTVSHYHEIRRSRFHPLHGVVSRQGLWEYLNSPVTIPLTWNLQARYLCETRTSVKRLAKIFRPDRRYSLMAGWELAGCYSYPSELRNLALHTLQNMDFVATTDKLDHAFPELAARYGISDEPCHENTRDHLAADLDDNIIQRIHDLTEVDRKLVETVRTS